MDNNMNKAQQPTGQTGQNTQQDAKQNQNPQGQANATQQPGNTDANQQNNNYGTLGIEEVDVLLMEDEDALDVDNSMYMDTTDQPGDAPIAEFDMEYATADPTGDYSCAVDADLADYAQALDTVDIFVADIDDTAQTSGKAGANADANAKATQAGYTPQPDQNEAQQGVDGGCGC